VYSGNSENIAMAMVEGEIIFDHCLFIKFDEKEILSRAQQKAEEIYRFSMEKNNFVRDV
jgi:hypothetical protein